MFPVAFRETLERTSVFVCIMHILTFQYMYVRFRNVYIQMLENYN